jgi:hypothetical protein
MQIKIEIIFLKERFFVVFFREPICLIPKKRLVCRLQFKILNMKG